LPIEDPKTRERIDKKCQADLEEIQNRMKQVGVERAYRVIGILEHTAKDIEHHIVPRLRNLIHSWKNRVFWTEMVLGVFIVVLAGFCFKMTDMNLKVFDLQNPVNLWIFGGVLITVLAFLHLKICKWAANRILKKLQCEKDINEDTREGLMRAFRKNTTPPRALFIGLINEPVGWGSRMHKRIGNILGNVNSYVQKLNDRFTNPSGKAIKKPASPQKTEEKAPATVA